MFYTRRGELTCTIEELQTFGNKVLLKNEGMHVIQPDGRRKIMFGDGVTPVSGLPYTIDMAAMQSYAAAAANSENNAAISAIAAAASAAVAGDAHTAFAIFLQYYLQYEREARTKNTSYEAEFLNEVQTVTLTNTLKFPFNNSQISVALATVRKTLNYNVSWEITSATGNVGDIVVSDKQLNGFKIAFDGSATSVTLKLRIKGGMLV